MCICAKVIVEHEICSSEDFAVKDDSVGRVFSDGFGEYRHSVYILHMPVSEKVEVAPRLSSAKSVGKRRD